MFTDKQFWLAVLERAVKTFAQVLAAANIVAWGDFALSANAAAVAAVLSVLTSIASAGAGFYGPSLATEGVVEPIEED